MHINRLIIMGLICLSLLACQEHSQPTMELKSVSFQELPNWDADHLIKAWPAFLRSCARVKNEEWLPVCAKAEALGLNINESQVRTFFENNFTPYKVTTDNSDQGLFTGYFVPEIRGSYTQSAEYSAPLFKRPADLVMIENLGIFREDSKGVRIAGRVVNGNLVPYYTHQEIDQGALKGNELLWVNDPLDAFFTQVQGSAVVQLDNGDRVRVAYAGTNGHPYTAIGKVLIEQQALTRDEVSMQSIRAWLNEHPEQMKSVLYQNASLVFFTQTPDNGAYGAQGVVLTPERSLAVDPVYIPYGTPIWLDITHPQAQTRMQQLVIAQDKGGAIKGPIRGDLFWGTGQAAGELAGIMKSTGSYYVLLPKEN